MCDDALGSCMICGCVVPPWFWVCWECAEAYGLKCPLADWPEWARDLKRLHETARREERERLEWEVEIDGERE